MSASFDPYHKWLGILPKDQPPHHYRLLGLEPFEDDLQVIEAAADRQLGFLRKFQAGEHAIACHKLLNEVSRARLCLLKPASKQAYDDELKQRLARLASTQTIPRITGANTTANTSAAGRNVSPLVLISAGVGIAVVVGLLALFLRGTGEENDPTHQGAVAGGAGVVPLKKVSVANDQPVAAGDQAKSNPASPSSPALPEGQTNILPLLNASHVLKGEWKIEKERLSSQHEDSPLGQILLPIDAPKEYTIHLTGTRLQTSKASWSHLAVGLVCGQHDCIYVLEPKPPKGVSGLQILDDRGWDNNETTLPGELIHDNVPFQFQAIVRSGNIEIRVDGRTVMDWDGNFSRLSRPSLWNQAAPHKLFLAAATQFVFTHLTIGPPLPRRSLPGGELKVGESVELLKYVDLNKDVWRGRWMKSGDAIASPETQYARFTIPYQVPDEYELQIDVHCESPGRGFYFGLPFQAGFAGVGIGNSSGKSNSLLIDYGAFSRDQHILSLKSVLTATQNKVVATVRKNRIVVQVGDEPVFDWRGDPRRFSAWPYWATPGRQITLGSNVFGHQIQSVKMTRLPPTEDFAKPAIPENGNLLAIVDVDRDTTHGYWKKTDKGVESASKVSSGLRFPAKLPANYEFRLVVECKSQIDYLALGLPVNGRAVQMELDARGGTSSGINWFEEKRSFENSTNIPQASSLFKIGELTTIQGRVLGRHLTVTVNGGDRPLFDLDIPDTLFDPIWRLREGWLTPEERLQMSVNAWATAYEILDARFRPLDSDSSPFPMLNLTASGKLAEPTGAGGVASAASSANSEDDPAADVAVDGRKEIPDAAAREKALTQIREIFQNEYANSKKDVEKLSFAVKLERLAGETSSDPAAKFVCLEQARKLAAEAGDLAKAFTLGEAAAQEFKLDLLEVKASTLIGAGPKLKGPLVNRDLADRALSLVDELLSTDQFQLAVDVAGTANQAAGRLKDKNLQFDTQQIRKEADDLLKEFTVADLARETLQANPEDTTANDTWGRWLCFHKNNWPEGLKLLQKAGDPQLQELAARDLNSDTLKEITELGTAWLEYAKAQKDHANAEFADRALFWLGQARAVATGLKKSQIESLMEQAVSTRDWNSPLTSLLQAIDKKVAQRKYVASEETKHYTGEPFQDLPIDGALLIGFNYRISVWRTFTVIKAVQPIYATKLGEKLGDWHGEVDGDVATIKARPGYAVYELASNVGTAVDAMQLSFARITRTGLDPNRRYSSRVIGGNWNMVTTRRSGQLPTAPIIGLFGHQNEFVRGLGIIVAK